MQNFQKRGVQLNPLNPPLNPPLTMHTLLSYSSDILNPNSPNDQNKLVILTMEIIIHYTVVSLDSDTEIIYYINADVSAAVSLPSSEYAVLLPSSE